MKKITVTILGLLIVFTNSYASDEASECVFDDEPFWTTQYASSSLERDHTIILDQPYPFHAINKFGELWQTESGREIIGNLKYRRNGTTVSQMQGYDSKRLIIHLQNVGCDDNIIRAVESRRKLEKIKFIYRNGMFVPIQPMAPANYEE